MDRPLRNRFEYGAKLASDIQDQIAYDQSSLVTNAYYEALNQQTAFPDAIDSGSSELIDEQNGYKDLPRAMAVLLSQLSRVTTKANALELVGMLSRHNGDGSAVFLLSNGWARAEPAIRDRFRIEKATVNSMFLYIIKYLTEAYGNIRTAAANMQYSQSAAAGGGPGTGGPGGSPPSIGPPSTSTAVTVYGKPPLSDNSVADDAEDIFYDAQTGDEIPGRSAVVNLPEVTQLLHAVPLYMPQNSRRAQLTSLMNFDQRTLNPVGRRRVDVFHDAQTGPIGKSPAAAGAASNAVDPEASRQYWESRQVVPAAKEQAIHDIGVEIDAAIINVEESEMGKRKRAALIRELKAYFSNAKKEIQRVRNEKGAAAHMAAQAKIDAITNRIMERIRTSDEIFPGLRPSAQEIARRAAPPLGPPVYGPFSPGFNPPRADWDKFDNSGANEEYLASLNKEGVQYPGRHIEKFLALAAEADKKVQAELAARRRKPAAKPLETPGSGYDTVAQDTAAQDEGVFQQARSRADEMVRMSSADLAKVPQGLPLPPELDRAVSALYQEMTKGPDQPISDFARKKDIPVEHLMQMGAYAEYVHVAAEISKDATPADYPRMEKELEEAKAELVDELRAVKRSWDAKRKTRPAALSLELPPRKHSAIRDGPSPAAAKAPTPKAPTPRLPKSPVVVDLTAEEDPRIAGTKRKDRPVGLRQKILPVPKRVLMLTNGEAVAPKSTARVGQQQIMERLAALQAKLKRPTATDGRSGPSSPRQRILPDEIAKMKKFAAIARAEQRVRNANAAVRASRNPRKKLKAKGLKVGGGAAKASRYLQILKGEVGAGNNNPRIKASIKKLSGK